jgi:hypothetical protein
MRKTGAALALILTSLVVGLGAAPSADARTYCGKLVTKTHGSKFTRKVYVLKGHVSCKWARHLIKASMVLKHYGHPARRWECVMLHAQDPYDITCGTPRGAEDYSKAIGSILLGD